MTRQTLWAPTFLDTPYSVSVCERAIRPSQRSAHDNTQQSKEIFDVFLTVHLSIILVINQLNAQILVL